MNNKKLFLLLLSLLVIAALSYLSYRWLFYQQMKVAQEKAIQSDQQEPVSTGRSIDALPTLSSQEDFRIKLRNYLPVKLGFSKVSFDYKRFVFQMEYCGELEQAKSEFNVFLQTNQLDPSRLHEDEIVFEDTGKCL